MKKRILSILLTALMILSLLPVTALAAEPADTVVYGTIRTADTENPVAEAIAVKDGKYVYVGDRAGAAAYIQDGVTEVIDHTGKGMVMPGCTDGHSHYLMKFGLDCMQGGVSLSAEDDRATVLQKLEAAALAAKAAGKETLFGFGWSYPGFAQDHLTLKELDDATHGISALIFDQGGHHAFCNSECLKRCGIIDDKGNVLIHKIDGGLLELDENGYPTGYADERATGYFMRNGGVNADEIVDDKTAETILQKSQELLLSTGYTMALDGWSNMLHPTRFYEAANRLDRGGKLKIIFPMTYEVEPWQTDMDGQIDYLASLNKTYGTRHVLPQYLKLFMDGVVETETGAMMTPYRDGTTYNSFWSVDRLADITAKCNAKDLTVHIHTMGDAAIKEVTDAYIQGGDKAHRNCMVHLRNVREEDFRRLADNNIACSAGMTWHAASVGQNAYLAAFLEDDYVYRAYPIKSFFDAGVRVSSHSDFPANIPCPQDPFGIMHVAVNGMVPEPLEGEEPYDTDELVTIGQAFQALTINGAWQLGLENERGSIEVGKYADFVLADQDVFTCAAEDIGKTKVVSTWFEGEKVYGAGACAITNGTAENTKETNHGYITIDSASAAKGETVTITVVPDKGFTPETITVTDASGSAQEVKNIGSDRFTFVMPASSVTVGATFMEDNSMLNFCVDVQASDHFYDAVLWAYENGICNGTDAVHFSPYAPVTRAQAVTFLWRAAGCTEAAHTAAQFKDVPPDAYYVKAVEWALSKGITKGTGETTFSPYAFCTRGQIVTFLARLADVKDDAAGYTHGFTDVTAADYYNNAVAWAYENKITEGVGKTTFAPMDECSRAQLVTFLYRYAVKT